jgi:prophage regulatory protein
MREAQKRVAKKRAQAQAARPANKPTLLRKLAPRATPLPWRLHAPPIGPPPRLLLTIDDVHDLTRLSRAQIYNLMGKGQFPRPVALGVQKRCWVASEVEAWLAERVAERGAV